MDQQAPRVFLSYSDDSAAHAERVLELAQWLRGHGIDARIDQFEDSPEQGWPRWIYAQIRESDFVLVVCTRDYLARCEGEVPRGVPCRGVVVVIPPTLGTGHRRGHRPAVVTCDDAGPPTV